MNNSTKNFENLVKVLILGDTSVGKTNFLLRFTENSFMENHLATIGFDYKSKLLTINDKTVKMQVWDTAGQERFMAITKNLFLRVQGVILMFDVTQPITYNNVEKWLKSIKENSDEKISIVLVGNKVDIGNNRVQYEEAKRLADEYEISYFEASAKNGTNVNEVFTDIALKIMTKYEKLMNNSNLVLKEQDDANERKGCC
jgi:Ras-related protein Rab-8A